MPGVLVLVLVPQLSDPALVPGPALVVLQRGVLQACFRCAAAATAGAASADVAVVVETPV